MLWPGPTAAHPCSPAAGETAAWSSGTLRPTSAPKRDSRLKLETRAAESVEVAFHRLVSLASCPPNSVVVSRHPPPLPTVRRDGRARKQLGPLRPARSRCRRARTAKLMDSRNQIHGTRSVATTQIEKRKILRNMLKFWNLPKRKTQRTKYTVIK